MRAVTYILICVFCEFPYASCVKKGGSCELPDTVENSEISLHIREKSTGQYSYTEFGSLYDKDSLIVIDPQGYNLPILYNLQNIPGTLNNYYILSFGPVYNPEVDQISYDKEVCKKYVIYYRPNQADTLNACFTSMKTKCGSVFETLHIYHKGSLIRSVKDSVSAHITLLK